MAIRWQIKFMSFLGTSYVLSIYDVNYTGSTITPLTGAAEPFVTSEDTDEVFYIPIRTQSGYIRFIVEDDSIVGEMMPVLATDRPVVLRTAAGEVCWVGFLSQEQYSQPWEPCPYEVEIPVVSVMMAMQGLQFTQADGYTSVLSLLNTINNYLPVDISAVMSDLSPIDQVFVQNRNFHKAETGGSSLSTSNESDTIYDCLEQFCLYFGVSLREYGGVFFFAVAGQNTAQYEDIDLNGNTRQPQWGSVTLAYLTICGASNKRDYSTPYRRVIGSFDTGKDMSEAVFEQPTFFERFSAQGAYPTSAPTNLLFYGDREIQPYKNGTQQTAWVDISAYEYGGQIIRHREERLNSVAANGSSWTDYFYVVSQKTQAGTASKAVVFNIPKKVYINNGEYAAFNINCNVSAWFDVTQGGDFIKRLYCKIKVGDYWLRTVEESGYLPRYEWTTTESVCFLLVDNGNITREGAQYTLDYREEAMMDSISGLAIDMPSGLSAGYYPVYLELLCNAETIDIFGDSAYIGYLVSGMKIDVLRATNSVTQPTPNLDSNDFTVVAADTRGGDYTVDCAITTKQGMQYGAGCALNSNKVYITTRYDQQGINRLANFVARSRDLLTIDVRKNIQPIDVVIQGDKEYAVLSQEINWRDDKNNIKIIEA